MRYTDIVSSCVTQFMAGVYSRVPYIEGAPGGGKSAAGHEIIKQLGIPHEKTVIIHASLYEPCDVLGLPNTQGDFVKWTPAEMFYKIRQGMGKCALLIEELPDALIPMQNALCGVIYDRRAGQLSLTNELAIIATGNRVKDKSGANRIVSKLANRVSRLEFTEHLEDWRKWYMGQIEQGRNLDPVLPSFLAFRPELLTQFQPERFANPTPRSWERVGLIPQSLPDDHYHEHLVGEVSEGPAAEYAGFKRIYHSLPPVATIFKDPDKAMVPNNPATLYALSGALSRGVDDKTIDNMVKYLQRLPAEFSVLTIKDCVTFNPKLTHTRAFGQWAMKNADILI